jgi:hypothetical protein
MTTPRNAAAANRVGSSRMFRDFVAGASPAAPTLPLVHLTYMRNLPELIAKNSIPATDCDVYKTNLCYFFYGKPAYQTKGDRASKLLPEAAVCLVLRTELLPEPRRVYPFDTGAFIEGRYGSYMPEKAELVDFELEPARESAARLVSLFYGNNQNYFRGEVATTKQLSALDYAAHTYRSLAASETSTDFDERCCTCELQFERDIPLGDGVLESIALPDRAYEDPALRKHCDEVWRIKPILYRLMRTSIKARTNVIFEKIGDYFDNQRYGEVAQ